MHQFGVNTSHGWDNSYEYTPHVHSYVHMGCKKMGSDQIKIKLIFIHINLRRKET